MHPGHTPSSRHKSRLWAVFALTSCFLAVEIVVALATGSLSLLADAAHMLVDTGGLLMSLLAVWFAGRPATPAKTYGYYRGEILAALVNGVVLCLLAVGILIKAYERLWQPPPVPGVPMLVLAGPDRHQHRGLPLPLRDGQGRPGRHRRSQGRFPCLA